MLPKLISDNGNFYKIEPIGFKDFSDFGLDVDFRERQFQPETEIYALNRKGEPCIFE